MRKEDKVRHLKHVNLLDLIAIVAVIIICSIAVGPLIDAGFNAVSGIIMWVLKWVLKIAAFMAVTILLLFLSYCIKTYVWKR